MFKRSRRRDREQQEKWSTGGRGYRGTDSVRRRWQRGFSKLLPATPKHLQAKGRRIARRRGPNGLRHHREDVVPRMVRPEGPTGHSHVQQEDAVRWILSHEGNEVGAQIEATICTRFVVADQTNHTGCSTRGWAIPRGYLSWKWSSKRSRRRICWITYSRWGSTRRRAFLSWRRSFRIWSILLEVGGCCWRAMQETGSSGIKFWKVSSERVSVWGNPLLVQ